MIGDVYRSLKHWGRKPILGPIDGFEATNFEPDAQAIIDEAYEAYKQFNGIKMSSMTHQIGSPWYDSWHKDSNHLWRTFGITTTIPDDLLKEYFRNLALHKTVEDESTEG